MKMKVKFVEVYMVRLLHTGYEEMVLRAAALCIGRP